MPEHGSKVGSGCYTAAVFTGLVQTTGVVRALREGPQSRRVVIGFESAPLTAADHEIGASVCVSGVCLTVTETGDDHFAADIAFETLAVTTLGRLTIGARVNIEPSLRLGDALGGHLVSGHVDGVGRLVRVEARDEARECWFWVPEPLRRYVAVKGSIAVDGVSLTVNRVDETGFMVGLIPHTLEVTTLGPLVELVGRVGHVGHVGHAAADGTAAVDVNLEVDMLARYVERLLQFPRVPQVI
jgi:riboflavin synthase